LSGATERADLGHVPPVAGALGLAGSTYRTDGFHRRYSFFSTSQQHFWYFLPLPHGHRSFLSDLSILSPIHTPLSGASLWPQHPENRGHENRGQGNNSKYFSKRCGNRPFSIL
jgi:hypothetical protein